MNAALPRQLTSLHARRFGVRSVEAPLALPSFPVSLLAPKVAMMDAGVAWLLDRRQHRVKPRLKRRTRSMRA
jgi:hypothetical protein